MTETKEKEETNRSQFSSGSNGNVKPDNEIKDGLKDLKEKSREDKETEEIKKEKQKEYNKKYKSKKQEKKEQEDFSKSFAGIGGFLLTTIIKRMPNPIPPNSEELATFNQLFTDVLYKYSAVMGQYQSEIALGSYTVMLMLPRLQKPKVELDPKIADENGKDFKKQ